MNKMHTHFCNQSRIFPASRSIHFIELLTQFYQSLEETKSTSTVWINDETILDDVITIVLQSPKGTESYELIEIIGEL